MKFNYLFLIIFLSILPACTGTLPGAVVHENQSEKVKIENLDQNESRIKIQKIENSDQPEYIFDINNWQNIKISKSTEFLRYIDRIFSENLKINNNEFFLKFEKTLDLICPLTLENCAHLLILKSTPRSISILEKIAIAQSEINRYYHFLYLALEVQNQVFSSSTVEMFLQKASEYKKFLKKNNNTQELLKLDKILHQFFEYYKDGKLQTKDDSWIKELDLLGSYKDSELSIAAEFIIYKDKKNEIITDQLKTEIEKNQNIPTSYTAKKLWIDKINPKIFINFNYLQPKMDEAFYLVEEIYSGRMTPRQGAMMVAKSQMNPEKPLKIINSFIQFEMIYLMTLSMNEMKTFISLKEQYPAKTYFSYAKKQFSRVSSESRSLEDRIQRLNQFIHILTPQNADISSISSQASKIEFQISKIQNSIKMNITYPNIFILSYLTAKAGIQQSDSIELPISLDLAYPTLGLMIKFLFLGKFPAILDFTTDSEPINSLELIESLEISSKANVYQELGINIDDLLSTFFDILMTYSPDNRNNNYNTSKIKTIINNQENLEQKYASSEWNSGILNSCDLFLNNQSPQRTLPFLEMLISPTLGSITKQLSDTFEGTSSRQTGNGTTLIEYGYFAYSKRSVTQLELIRSDLFSLLRYFTTIKNVLEKQKNIQMTKLTTSMDSLKIRIRKFITLFQSRMQEFDRCYFLITDRENKIMTKIISYEEQYWSAVHKQMTLLRKKQPTNALWLKYPLNYQLPQNVEWRTKINSNSTITYFSDFLLRSKNYLENGLQLPLTQLPPLDANLIITLDEGLSRTSDYKKSEFREIPYVENETQFVRNAMQTKWFKSSLSWFTNFYTNTYNFTNMYDAYTIFFRMSPQINEILNIKIDNKLEYLVSLPRKVINFLSIKPEEDLAFNSIGVSGRLDIQNMKIYETPFLANAETTASHDYLLNSITARWMGDFGSSIFDSSENVKIGVIRPDDLIPISVIADQVFIYHQNQAAQLFSDSTLLSSEVIEKTYQVMIENDMKQILDFKQAVLEKAKQYQGPLLVKYSTSEVTQINTYTLGAMGNLDAYILNFHKRTDNFFKTKSQP